MPAREVRKLGDPVLRRVNAAVTPEQLASVETQALIDDLIDTMHAAHGAGIAAPQVGAPVRIAVVHVRDNPRYPYKPNYPLTVFVNPRLTLLGEPGRDDERIFEGCLSVPDLRGEVVRRMHVRCDALDRHGAPVSVEVRGLTAGTFQHELDHLDGRLFVDRVMDPSTLTTWANFDLYHREAFVRRAADIVARWGG